jgi:hypothetical protein
MKPTSSSLSLPRPLRSHSLPSASGSWACAFCSHSLIKNPGAEAGRGLNAVAASGAVPVCTNVAGEFGAAAYSGFGVGWFSAASKGPQNKGRNYFFGGTTTKATGAQASIGTQTIQLPAAAAGRKVTLSGWLGNDSSNTTQVRAEFIDSTGKVVSAIRLGPNTTIAGEDMAFRIRTSSVPAAAKSVRIVVTFTDRANHNLAGADDLSLVLS